MTRPRAADDFAAIRARMEELRLERDRALTGQKVDSGPGTSRTATRKDEGPDDQRLFRSMVPRRFVR